MEPPAPAPEEGQAAATTAPRPGAVTGPLSIAEIYRRSLKPQDLRFNNWVCRPPAAVLVYLLRSTRVTPNQVTFFSLFVHLCGCASLLFWRQPAGLWAAAFIGYLAFVLDCVDGQLARITGKTSTVGSYLDFLVDELKAFTLIAAVAGRLAFIGAPLPGPLGALLYPAGVLSPTVFWLVIGLCGVVIAASGISITTFTRRPEYFEAVHGTKGERVPGFTRFKEPVKDAPPPSLVGQLVRLPVRVLEGLGKMALHYPAWFYIPALLDRIEWFLLPYLLAHALYLSRAGLVVLIKLGR
ncbi:MAG: CDP-alcohol phosphatidyltransferase family protein [Polyangia bacterium]